MTKKFLTPFATDGDRSEIPGAIQSDGSISLPEGWGFDYSRNPSTDPLAKRIDRAAMNWLFYAITQALGQIQQTGAPEWITAADNGGTAFPYEQGAIVRYSGVTYNSLAGDNTAIPGTDPTKWAVLDLSLLAPLASPAFTGTPTVPTAEPGTNSAQVANTAFVTAALAAISLTGYARLDTAQEWTRLQKAAPQALTSGAAWDGELYQHLTATVNGGLFTVANPSAQTAGAFYAVFVTYTTAHSLAFDSVFKGVSGLVPTATSGAADIFYFRSNGTHLQCVGARTNVGA